MNAVSEEEKRADSIRHATSNINLDKSGMSIVGRHLRKPRVAWFLAVAFDGNF